MDSGYLKSEAKKALEGKWKNFALCMLVYWAISAVVSAPDLISQAYKVAYNFGSSFPLDFNGVVTISSNPVFSLSLNAISFFITPIFSYGLYSIALKVQKGEDFELSNFFDGFGNYVNILIMSILETVFVILWSLLFIIPGIIKSLSYSMTYFVMAEEPDIRPMDALKKSEELMDGHKLDFFILCLSFFGWAILSVLTLGILGLWAQPYMYTSYAEFYQRIKKEKYGDTDQYEGTPYAGYVNGYNPYQQPTQQQNYQNPNYVQPGYAAPVQTPTQSPMQYAPPVQSQAPVQPQYPAQPQYSAQPQYPVQPQPPAYEQKPYDPESDN